MAHCLLSLFVLPQEQIQAPGCFPWTLVDGPHEDLEQSLLHMTEALLGWLQQARSAEAGVGPAAGTAAPYAARSPGTSNFP